jgi:hypothetical protein
MTSNTAKRPEFVEDLLKVLSFLSFDFDVMSLTCLGVEYDFGMKLMGMVALVFGLMLCPLLHLLRMQGKVLRRNPKHWFKTLDTGNHGNSSVDMESVKAFLAKRLKLKQNDIDELIDRIDTNGGGRETNPLRTIDLPAFKEVMRQARGMIKQDIQALIIRDVMMVILLFHPFVSGLAMRAWKCTPVVSSTGEPAKSFLDIDMTITCFTTSKWIGIAVFSGATILLFSLGAPAVLLFTLVRRREKLGEKATFKRFGILYSSWRPAFFFFEPIELLFKLLLWVAVVASTDEQIQNAAVVSLLTVFVMVRVGLKPSMKTWKNHAEAVALGFSLVLKLHDLVHSYLIASKNSAIDEKMANEWQALINESDYFLSALFAATIAVAALCLVFKTFRKCTCRKCMRRACCGLLKKRACRRCLRRVCCGCQCKCCRPEWRDVVAENPHIGAQNTGTLKHKTSTAMEMYSRGASNSSSGARSSVGSESKSATAQKQIGMKKKISSFDTSANTQSRPQNGGDGTSEGGAEVRQDSTVLHDNPMSFIALAGRRTKLGGKGQRLRKQVTGEAAEHNAYQAAHAEHVGQMLNRGKGRSRWGFLSAHVRSMSVSPNDKQIAELVKQLTESDKEEVIATIRSILERKETSVQAPLTAKRWPGRRMVSDASSHVEDRGGTVESKRTDSSTRRGNTLRFAASPNAALQKTRKKMTATAAQERGGGGSSGIVSIDVDENDGAGSAGSEAVEVVMGSSRLDGDLPQTSIPTSMWLDNPAFPAGSRASASSFGSHGRLSDAVSDAVSDAESYLPAVASDSASIRVGREWNLSTEARASGGGEAKTADTVPVVPAAYGSVAHGTRSMDIL